MNVLKCKRKIFLFVFLAIALIIATKHTSEAATGTEQITITYKVDVSTDVTGLSDEYLYEGITIPTVQGNATYTTTINSGESITLESLSTEYVTPYDSVTTYNTKDRKVLKFTGWKVGNTNTILLSETELTWAQLSSYAVNGKITLTTTWKNDFVNYEYANFYINYKSEVLDSEGDVSTRDEDNFTPSLWATYVGNSNEDSENLVGSTKDNSFQVNADIRALHGDKGNGSIYFATFPSDEYVLEKLKTYVDVLSIDGQVIDKNELDLEHYSIRWYVFKLQSGCWHIDGKLVRNEGKMTITKTFIGEQTAIDQVKDNFYINLKGGDIDEKLYISDSDSKNGETYKWVVDIKYGINYTLSEHNYEVDKYIINTVHKIVDPENVQSTNSITSTVATVVGVNNYAIDSLEVLDTSKILTVNFTNTYAPTTAITIQKEDSITHNGLANAKFLLYKDDTPLTFSYDQSIYTHDKNGKITELTSSANGAIIIDGLLVNQTYKLVEISAPEGYDNQNLAEVTLEVDGSGEITATPATGYDKTNKILKIPNTSKQTSVKITKQWFSVPEIHIKEVKIKLYLNNNPITDFAENTQMEVVLNKENNWTYEWQNLPLYIDGNEAVYSVREVQIGEIQANTEGRYDAAKGVWESYDAYSLYRAYTTPQQETKDENGEVTQINLELVNKTNTPMPMTGGCGIYKFYVLGILLMGCSVILINLKKIRKG